MTWYPHVTVATVVEKHGEFLLVKEESEGQIVFNQPAGHLEQRETLIDAAIRETLEETGWDIKIKHLIGVQHYLSPQNGITYLRFTFAAIPLNHRPDYSLDSGIICAEWKAIDEIKKLDSSLRSPMVLADIIRYQQGEKYPLELISTLFY